MSELKAYLCEKASEIETKEFLCYRFKSATKPSLKATMEEVYLKYEADEVIAELEKEVEQLLILNCEQAYAANRLRDSMEQALRHHKYKRCLDKAELCEAMYDKEDAKVNGCGASWEYISKEMKYWERWRWRWEALAEKFKHNSTAQKAKDTNHV